MKWEAKLRTDWRPVFAVLPTKIYRTWIWLEWYERAGHPAVYGLYQRRLITKGENKKEV